SGRGDKQERSDGRRQERQDQGNGSHLETLSRPVRGPDENAKRKMQPRRAQGELADGAARRQAYYDSVLLFARASEPVGAPSTQLLALPPVQYRRGAPLRPARPP